MAGLVDKFKRMWDTPDEEYDDYDEYDDYSSNSSEEETPVTRSSADYDYGNSYAESSYERETPSDHRRNKVVNINATAKLQVVLFKPETFGEETRAIADELIKTHTVVLNLENTNRDVSRRIIDFLSGCAYANRGQIKKIGRAPCRERV